MKPRWHKFQQRFRNGEACRAKQIACRDMASETGEGKLYSKQYVQFEYVILQMPKYNPIIIQIP